MINFNLTLRDENNKLVWGINPKEIINNNNVNMHVKDGGVYNTSTFNIKSNSKIVGHIEVGQYGPVLLPKKI